jgi:hypothetical protein
MNNEYADFLKNKSIVLVGPAPTLIGTNFGEEIDKHDVVVRMNHHFNLNEELMRDYGKRTDVLYINTSFFRKHRNSLSEIKKENLIQFIMKKSKIVSNITLSLTVRKKGLTLGSLAYLDLLSYPISNLLITGFSFYSDDLIKYAKEDDEFNSHINAFSKKEFWKNFRFKRGHNIKNDMRILKEKLSTDNRLKLDERSKKFLNEKK